MSNIPIVTEVVVLLELIIIIYCKSKHIQNGTIVALTDNKILARRINNKIKKVNLLALDTEVEIAEIKDIIEKLMINIVVGYTKGKPTITKPFREDPDLHLITIYHNKATRAIKEIE